MATKQYRVLKSVKIGGKELLEGAVVNLDQKTADGLIGVFVEEHKAPHGAQEPAVPEPEPTPESRSVAADYDAETRTTNKGKVGRGRDGL